MCQAKSAGGKRCFLHSSGTKAALTYINLKTGIDKAEIYAIMKELRKEGRMLDAPSPEEVEKYFDLEEFKTKFDNTLTEKEKVAILKQLLSARAEAKEQGVSGGVFHSWKNALGRVVDKIRRPFVAIAMASTLLVTASCSAGVTPGPTQPEETKSPTAAECVIENPEELGFAVADEIRTDEYGSYCHVTVSPDSKEGYMTIADSPNADAIKAAGFTEEDVVKAQETAYGLLVETTLDGERLDNYKESITEWYNTTGKKIVDEDFHQYYDSALERNGENNLGLMVTDSFSGGNLVRDNGTRISQVKIATTGLNVIESEGTSYLQVVTTSSAAYRASNEGIIATVQKNLPDMTIEQIKEQNPDLVDPAGESFYVISAEQTTAYKQGKLDKLAGSSLIYSLFTSSVSSTILTQK